MERELRKNDIKNTILLTINYTMVAILVFGICTIDSQNDTIPTLMIIVSGIYLALSAYANGLIGELTE